MGRRRPDGTVEPLVRLARVHVESVGWQRLDAISPESVAREGVAGVTTPAEFIAFYTAAFRLRPGDPGARDPLALPAEASKLAGVLHIV